MGTPHFYFNIKVSIIQTIDRQSLTKISLQVLFQWNDLQGQETSKFEFLAAVLRESRVQKLCTCQLSIQSILQATKISIYLTWCDDGYYNVEYMANEKFVLASESNLSLATALKNWKVSLEPGIKGLELEHDDNAWMLPPEPGANWSGVSFQIPPACPYQ